MKENYYDEEVRPIARCLECGELIFDDNKNFYVNEDGEYFCGVSCVLNFYGVHLSEDCMVSDDE